ncbi:hypothetical protein P879_12002 [Paragonimus westermani]|uniref:Uncharacterized protein n=1 Tax=Paragonimus westermani TaxID=34504 RepID=A0A8T0D8D4_9TREM|nr:hypothetical protein P879_12002 [Paragonimus westermani]
MENMSMSECTLNVMRRQLTDEVAESLNWRGVNNHVSIASSPLAAAVVGRFDHKQSSLVNCEIHYEDGSPRHIARGHHGNHSTVDSEGEVSGSG